tara:strand:+ start:899 stop:1636 length:738 start_codon:yes stop_codon:yes gene_type:complete
MYKIKKFLCNLMPTRNLRRQCRSKFLHGINHNAPEKTYSQEGEDIILKRYFENRKNGFYVDIGAHHPYRYSNTALLREMGWSGINIEPSPDLIEKFYRFRPEDINLNLGVSFDQGEMIFYKFNEQLINTFSEDLALSRNGKNGWKITDKILIKTVSLCNILQENINENQKIDLLSVDTEGLDYEVIKSNDWNKYRPEIIVVEMYEIMHIKHVLSSELCSFLEQKDYCVFAKTMNSVFFVDQKIKA